MGCGSSGNVVPATDESANGHANKIANGKGNHDNDDLPTVVLPDTPAVAKPPIAFEIPLEEFEGNRIKASTPPPHVQRLLEPPKNDISLPDIEEKLAEAEQRRREILQQRAASAQKRAAKMMKSFEEMDRVDSEQEPGNVEQNNTKNRAMTGTKQDNQQMDKINPSKEENSLNEDNKIKNLIDVQQVNETNRFGTATKLRDGTDKVKTNGVHIRQGVCEDKNIT